MAFIKFFKQVPPLIQKCSEKYFKQIVLNTETKVFSHNL